MTRKPISKRLLGNAKKMRSAMTAAELKLWNQLRAHRLMGLSFRRQVSIGPYIVDFACPKHHLIIEVDGASHSFDDAIEHDEKRTRFLAENGWQVIRFTNDEVLETIDDCCTHILAFLAENGVKELT